MPGMYSYRESQGDPEHVLLARKHVLICVCSSRLRRIADEMPFHLQVGGSRNGLWIPETLHGVTMIPSLARGCLRRWGGLKERYCIESLKYPLPSQRTANQKIAFLESGRTLCFRPVINFGELNCDQVVN